jgi:filamentous haemagglutinin family N-terminal domain
MKTNHSFAKSFSIKTLAAAIAACAIVPPYAHAGPTGGVVVDGAGSITQAGANTRVDQVSDRLSLEWDTFNVGRNERVQFVQPGADAIALNRILDNSGSQILGRIDANGQVILMNPNGIIFGRDAVINVGGLVASGLNISSDNFMNGDLVFSGLEGTAGTVVNRGLINAAVGGNVALLGKSVTNQGLISAELGHVALAAGNEAVVTFDDQGLIGVRIDQETLAEELGTAYAVNNNGTIEAKGGKILLNASVSADLFSAAVNSGGMGSNDVVFHDDGSFSIGSGNGVINSGNLNVSTDATSTRNAGTVVVAGGNVEQRGTISANASGVNNAGAVYLSGYEKVRMSGAGKIEAKADNTSGKISLEADDIQAGSGTSVATAGNTYIRGYLNARTPKITAENLKISSLGTVTQAAATEVAGTTHISTTAGGNIRLTNADNDFNLVTITTGYNDSVRITDQNDIVLGAITMDDSSLRVDSLGEGGTISQAPGSQLHLSAGELRLTADNILLGDGGATTRLTGASLIADFRRSIATNGSVSLLPYIGDIYASTSRIRGVDREYGDVFLDLRGNRVIDLNAEYDADMSQLHLHGMTGANATLSGLTETDQTAPIFLTGTLTWNSYIATLTNPDNDIANLQGSGGPAFGWLTYVDKNDLQLRNLLTDNEVSLDVKSVGEGSTIRQAANTGLKADFINLEADNLVLGSNGRSSIYAGYVLDLKFGDNMILNGSWAMGGWYAPMFRITGDDSDNRLVFGPYATNNAFAGDGLLAHLEIQLLGGNDTLIFDSPFPVGNAEFYSVNLIDMGAGNDRVVYNQSVHIPLILGEGSDVLRLRNDSIFYDVLDYVPGEDQLVIATP